MKFSEKFLPFLVALSTALTPFTAFGYGAHPLKGRDLTNIKQALTSLVYLNTYHCPVDLKHGPRTIIGSYGLVDDRFEISEDGLHARIRLGQKTYLVDGVESENSDRDMVDFKVSLTNGVVLATYESILSYEISVIPALAVVTGVSIPEVTDVSLKSQCFE